MKGSEVTNHIVGKQEENSKVLAECSDVRIVCQFSYTKAISPVSRSNWSVLIVTLIQLLHIIMLLSTVNQATSWYFESAGSLTLSTYLPLYHLGPFSFMTTVGSVANVIVPSVDTFYSLSCVWQSVYDEPWPIMPPEALGLQSCKYTVQAYSRPEFDKASWVWSSKGMINSILCSNYIFSYAPLLSFGDNVHCPSAVW